MNRLEDKSKEELIAIINGCSKSIKHLKSNRKLRLKWAEEKYDRLSKRYGELISELATLSYKQDSKHKKHESNYNPLVWLERLYKMVLG